MRAAIGIAFVATTLGAGSRGAQAAGSIAPRWEISAGMGYGTPRGWVQVREDSVPGTRLSLAGALRVRRVQTAQLDISYHPSDRSSYALAITAYELDGSTVPPAPVDFNGATLAAGAVLATRTHFSNFIAARLTGAWRVAAPAGGELRVRGGLSFVALTFVMQGTLALGSATRETQEDFVTQELPVPIVGVEYALALARWVRLDASLAGGYLPWVNSGRTEGGTVTISQSEGSASIGARFALAPTFAVDATLHYATLAQHEQSGEDGNDIQVSATTLSLALVGRF